MIRMRICDDIAINKYSSYSNETSRDGKNNWLKYYTRWLDDQGDANLNQFH